ncbi:MAG: MaoC family dehydratase N-terminal domain-containing protein [Deltaproteobacteria bacterium]|nr:MaoC family dehydratase N-terminal domain-containing protein [Deltaproteobacteria bacterium]MBI4374228.1 MaoC family dehydratase N-terminal domain-containing protein [Deltaproteobacteria bacterium]
MKELSKEIPVDLKKVRAPEYGRVLEDFQPGEVFCHPRGITIDRNFAIDFATTFMEANPLYLNAEYAKGHGFSELVVSPMMVLNLAISLGVQNDSEKAAANLGYYDVEFPAVVYPGDTLRGLTKVIDKKERGDKPGIVTIRTVALNQKNEVACRYNRKIMVAPAGKKSEPATVLGQSFPEEGESQPSIPAVKGSYPIHLTGTKTYFEDFQAGEIIVHKNGRTITEEHIPWTYRLMNTHPLHYDRLYAKGAGLSETGLPVVYGGLVFAWLCGLASRDTSENALWDLGYTEGYHTQPAYSGDTVTSISRILTKEGFSPKAGLPAEALAKAGVVQIQLIGLKNIPALDALRQFGADLFLKEKDKKEMGKEKISQKIFEIERRLLVKKRPGNR